MGGLNHVFGASSGTDGTFLYVVSLLPGVEPRLIHMVAEEFTAQKRANSNVQGLYKSLLA